MKQLILCKIFLLIVTIGSAQSVAINNDGSLANPNAMLDIKGVNKGLLIPRGDNTTRINLQFNTGKGLLLYDTLTSTLWSHNGSGSMSGWSSFSTGQNLWTLAGSNGNEARNTNTGGFWSVNATTVLSELSVTPPILNAGTRLMWMPSKSAFRAGTVDGNDWNTDSIGTWSIGLGFNAKAKGPASIAIGTNNSSTGYTAVTAGYGNHARGFVSTAIGLNNIASGDGAVAIGDSAKATAFQSFAIGSLVRATEIYSTALGYNTTASGIYALVGGVNNVSSGDAATAFGAANIASGDSSFAIGYGTTSAGKYSFTSGAFSQGNGSHSYAGNFNTRANGVASVALNSSTQALGNNGVSTGLSTRVTGDNGVSMGVQTVARGYNSLAIGQFNDSLSTAVTNFFSGTSPLFYIGNGTSDAARKNAMVVYQNGNMDFNGDVRLTGEMQTPSKTGTSNIVPVCYGNIAGNGGINSGSTFNFSVTKTLTGLYEITITGETFQFQSYVAIVTPIGNNPRMVTTGSGGGRLQVYTWTTAGAAVDEAFQFVVYKP